MFLKCLLNLTDSVRLLSALFLCALACLSAPDAHSQTPAQNQTPIQNQTQTQALDTLFQEYHSRGEFDGVALIARQGKILYQKGFGLADRQRNLPNALSTPYPICSITKQFTSLLVMQLVEQGKLRLDGVITDYLPDFRRDTGSRVTLKQLLNHTSGLATLDEALPEVNGVPGFYASVDPRFTDAAYVIQTYLQGDLKTKPGEKFNYNNADYVVLEAIIAGVTGKSYADALREGILAPLGMRHTGLIRRDDFAARHALGYVREKDVFKPEPYFHRANFGAAGAMYSTVGDMLKWDRALDTDQILGVKYREIMFTPARELGFVALGSWVYAASLPGVKPAPLLVERDGAIGAFNILNLRAPKEEYSVILFSNVDTANLGAIYSGKGLSFDVVRTLYQTQPQTPPRTSAGAVSPSSENAR